MEFRRGSGVYVRALKPETPLSSALAVDHLIAQLFRSARKLGISLPDLRMRLHHRLELQPPDHFLLIEPDEPLRTIIAAEIAQAVTFPVRGCRIDDLPIPPDGAIPVALPNRVSLVRQKLPAGTELLTLQVSSVPASLAGWLPAPSGALIGIASAWPGFLKTAHTVLTAAGFHPDSLMFRDAAKPHWRRGLEQTLAVVCDLLTARLLPAGCRAIAFSLLSESSIAELRRSQEFIHHPLQPL